jgi:hypothetical protein
MKFLIHRNSTQKHMHLNSRHPFKCKLLSINYLQNRLHVYPIAKEAKDFELNIINSILRNSKYISIQTKEIKKYVSTTKNKMSSLYMREKSNKDTKLFQDRKIEMAFRTQNIMEDLVF